MLLRVKKAKFQRLSGILLPLSSLPSENGIGDLGEEAYKFIDFLKESNQTYWQLLPLCPVGKGNSPYSSTSTFAGEILYINIKRLVDWGLISPSNIPESVFCENVDYKAVRNFKIPLLKEAALNFNIESKDFLKFKRENRFWLKDYALFMAIKDSFGGATMDFWDEPLKYRDKEALLLFEDMHPEEILFYEITQYLFHYQYKQLKLYAEKNGIKLIGDIPFYVSHDSADVWSNPECFRLGKDLTPMLVAGVPPDIFSSEGQLWGNPIYDWTYQKKSGYAWWKQRLIKNAKMYDALRIDHFRAFADYYTIPYGAQNARSGNWEKGVGAAFWKTVKPSIRHCEIIAEDLGGDTQEVYALIKKTEFPDMKVLQFAFDSDIKNKFLPKNYEKNCICYTGTHDNDTTLGWYEKASEKEKSLFQKLVPSDKSGSVVLSLISFGMKSKARTVIIPLQDYLELPSSCRTNTPGTEKGNWEWRFRKGDLTTELAEKIIGLTKNRN